MTPEKVEELINKLNKLIELISQNEIEIHVKEVEKSTRIKIENSGYNSAGFDHSKSGTLAELKRVKKGSRRYGPSNGIKL